MALNITITWPTYPAGVPITLAALRRAATVSLTGSVATGDIAAGAVTAALITPGAMWYGVDAGTTDDYAVTFNPAVAALVDGLLLCFKANTKNTGACTLNANGLGAKPIMKCGGLRALDDNDIRALGIVVVRYNTAVAGYFEILSLLGNAPKDYPQQPASPYSAGAGGITTAPQAGDQQKVWLGNATWADLGPLMDLRLSGAHEMFKRQTYI